MVRKKEQKGKGEGAVENRSYTESPGVFKSGPNTGKGKEGPSTLLGKGCLAGLREEDCSDLELTTLKPTRIHHFLCAKVYQWFRGILLGSRCSFSEGRGKKELNEGKKWEGRVGEVRGKDGQGK